ncbi:MAG: SDR family NAD(P)-dependent oxidoreductase [Lachnospiraceae bacterium]
MGIIEKMRLDGKKGFVTGAARGIGKCTATAFAEAGADIAIIDMDIAAAEATAKEIAGATGRKVIALKCDVTDEAQVQAMVDEVVKQLGGLAMTVPQASRVLLPSSASSSAICGFLSFCALYWQSQIYSGNWIPVRMRCAQNWTHAAGNCRNWSKNGNFKENHE